MIKTTFAAKLIKKEEYKKGETKNGKIYFSQDVLLDDCSQYKNIIKASCFSVNTNDIPAKLKQSPLNLVYFFEVEIGCNEYNGRYYTDINIVGFRPEDENESQISRIELMKKQEAEQEAPEGDDLPF